MSISHSPSFGSSLQVRAPIAIIATKWYPEIVEPMIQAAEKTIEKAGGSADVYRVAGAFELPLIAGTLLDVDVYEGVVCLGAIVRGETPHFEYVSDAVTRGIMDMQLSQMKPIGFGVLTVDTLEQAKDRAGLPGSRESKGQEAAEAVLNSIMLLEELIEIDDDEDFDEDSLYYEDSQNEDFE